MTRPVYLKAIVGAVLALATWGATAFAPDENGEVAVTAVEWFALLGALATAAGVYFAKNGEETDPTTSTPGPGLSTGPLDGHL